jgi:deazaflavin-dependent oxidoreductase (nitroreductase family)
MSPKADIALDRKLRREIVLGRYVANPAMRALFKIGVTPPFHTLIETTGRTSGVTRRVPIAYGRSGEQVWVVAQHGARAGWVLNLRADPHVRLLLGGTWLPGTTHLVPDDDVKARVATFSSSAVGRKMLGATFAALETRPCSVRIDLEPAPTA